MTTSPVPPWKIWHPLSFVKVVAILFVAQIVCVIPIVALREGLGVPVPMWVGSGLAGLLGWVVIMMLAQRAKKADAPS